MPAELYGPFGALVVLGIVLTGFIHGDLVPGWLYKAAVARAEKADAQTEANTEALVVLAKAAADAHGALVTRTATDARLSRASKRV